MAHFQSRDGMTDQGGLREYDILEMVRQEHEMGAYAFYHPNADVLNAGRPSVRSFYPMSAFASSAHYPRVRKLRRHRE